MARALADRNMNDTHYLVSSCLIHNLQACLRNMVSTIFGEEGINEQGGPVMNMM